jgi:hypothetical protein
MRLRFGPFCSYSASGFACAPLELGAAGPTGRHARVDSAQSSVCVVRSRGDSAGDPPPIVGGGGARPSALRRTVARGFASGRCCAPRRPYCRSSSGGHRASELTCEFRSNWRCSQAIRLANRHALWRARGRAGIVGREAKHFGMRDKQTEPRPPRRDGARNADQRASTASSSALRSAVVVAAAHARARC